MQVLFEITDPELHILDEFEDFEYERNVVEVSLVVSIPILLLSYTLVGSMQLDVLIPLVVNAYGWEYVPLT